MSGRGVKRKGGLGGQDGGGAERRRCPGPQGLLEEILCTGGSGRAPTADWGRGGEVAA